MAGLKENIERLARDRAFGVEMSQRQLRDWRQPTRVARPGYKSTRVTISPDVEIEFQESREGPTRVVSHRVPQEGVDFVAQEGTLFFRRDRQILPSCEVLSGPCVSDSRGIGSLHLGKERLVARAVREAEVLA